MYPEQAFLLKMLQGHKYTLFVGYETTEIHSTLLT